MAKKHFLFAVVLTILVLISPPKTIWAQSAILYFSPSGGTFDQGESFWVALMADTKGTAVNAVAAYFSYPEDKLEALGVSTAGSAMTIWAEKNAGSGKVEIAGGLPTPGFSGIQKIASVGFKVKASSGSAALKFSEESAILTNADNKNILNLALSGKGNFSFVSISLPPGKSTGKMPSEEVKLPLISEVSVKEITRNEAVIVWRTDQKTDSEVEYGLNSNLGLTENDGQLVAEHSLKLANLSPATLYYYQVKSRVASGQEAKSGILDFVTLGYKGEIKVLNSKTNQPLSGVQIFSLLPRETAKTADKEGKVFFDDLVAGKQWVVVKCQGNSFAYQIEVLAKEELQFFEVKVPVSRSISSLLAILAAILTISLAGAFVWTLIERRFQLRS